MEAIEITNTMKIASLKREIAMRKAVYKGGILNGRMTQQAADLEIAIMTAILHDYLKGEDQNES